VRKRPTEVDAQLGIVVALAREAREAWRGRPEADVLHTPLLSRLVELIHDIERGAREQSLETLDALASTLASAGASAIRV
jgi:2-dehydropantoate 2-reductase